ncbi:MAG: DNA-3-methyladenine glycosylase I [Chloroflexi bacterium]|nr:DNA-3-methyladenine glycosylase I [Chloroflexota bacterium]MDA1145441.1 DNA-3-methyladenine glycosylase I [Chloroflexota bacterium]
MAEESEYGAPPRIKPKRLGDYLDVMSKSVFQSGMSWKVVEAKWDTTREAFHDFDAERVASMSEAEIDALASDTRVIRNRRKLEAVVSNAARLIELDAEHGTFRKYLRSQPDFEATVKMLKQDFKFLGDMGSYVMLYVVGEPVPSHQEWTATQVERRSRQARPKR